MGTGQPPVGRCEDKRRPPESLHENRAHPRLILQETESKQELIVGNKLGQKLEQEPLVGFEFARVQTRVVDSAYHEPKLRTKVQKR